MPKKNSTIRLPFPELLYPYSPVAKPMPPPPIQNVCEGGLVCVSFSCSLVPYILGLLEVYRYKDSFTGTDEEKAIAVGVMRQLMEVFGMACCGDDSSVIKLHRINPETGQLEQSTDGGDTWTTDPQSPYVMGTTPRPLSGANGDVKRCEACNNVIEHMKDLQAKYSAMIGTINDVGEIIAAVLVEAAAMLFLPLLGAALITLLLPLASKVWDVASTLLGTSQAAYDLLFTEENWTLVRCILYCNCNEDGTFTQGQWSTIVAQIKEQITLPDWRAGANTAQMIEFWTVVGLNNAARVGSGVEGNCDDCDCNEWCYTFEFSEGAQSWTSYGQCAGATSALVTEGWQGDCNTCGYFETSVERTVTGTFTSVEFRGWLEIDTGLPDAGIIVNGEQVYAHTAPQFESLHRANGFWSGSVNIKMFANCQCDSFTQIRAITLRGTGSNPFGDDNCE